MKKIHLFHLIALITLFCAGIYWVGAIEKAGRPSDFFPSSNSIPSTQLAALAGMVVFAFSAFIGWNVRAERPWLGTIWCLAGLGGSGWMVLMWWSPTHITLIEVFPFWIVYIILGTIGSAYSINTLKGIGYSPINNYEEELLDD